MTKFYIEQRAHYKGTTYALGEAHANIANAEPDMHRAILYCECPIGKAYQDTRVKVEALKIILKKEGLE